MLILKDIFKTYKTGDTCVEALKGVSLDFRKSEFVSVLGQSGCGKTTMLNIIGGLDRYTDGDLIINGKSTKDFTDSDWDSYRNHSIGFVFQSYNLILHQTVLSNVELALTLSGVSKSERRRRAKEALELVGLGDQLNKKPNEMSGGQMQRVAIARALVNNPDILLADEPTGALDSETSVQIMEILKEISKDKLVIMVTHNPDLAEKYSTRIIRLLDGKVTDDSNPYEHSEENCKDEQVKLSHKEAKKAKKERKNRSMSFLTALSLSLNNLMTKKTRTFLTSFAGSIGIIGIALITALSNGMQNYIDRTQSDTLANYPIAIEKQSVDMMSMMMSASNAVANDVETADDSKAHTQRYVWEQINSVTKASKTNDLKSFKEYIEKNKDEISEYTVDIRYSYNTKLFVFNDTNKNEIIKVNPNTLTVDTGMDKYLASQFDSMASQYVMTTDVDLFTEIFDDGPLRNSTYELLEGDMPQKYNEVVLLLDKDNRISDYSLYTLGLLDRNELVENMKNPNPDAEPDYRDYEFSEFIGLKFKVLAASDMYEKNEQSGGYTDRSADNEYLKKVTKDALELKVVGVAKFTEDASSVTSTIGGMVGYLPSLNDYIMQRNNNSEIVKAQLDNHEVDVFTGYKFKTGDDIENEIANFDISAIEPMYQPLFYGLEGEELERAIRSYITMTSPTTTYEDNLSLLGAVTNDDPSAIKIYCKDFDSKDKVEQFIKNYNKTLDSDKEISYTDYIGLMMNSVTTIIDVISYVLIAFVSISLIVSSIMIGIITYISVLERTKEIGILRSIGASKSDILRVFNAETMIVGLSAGIIGILTTTLLCFPINAVIHALSGINDVNAVLPAGAAIILIIISVTLTVIAGLFPSRIASKKDPVVALRSE